MGREAGFSFYIHRAAYQNRVSRELAVRLPQPIGYRCREGGAFALRPGSGAGSRGHSLCCRGKRDGLRDKPFYLRRSDQTVIISYLPISLQVGAERTGKVPALDLLRSM